MGPRPPVKFWTAGRLGRLAVGRPPTSGVMCQRHSSALSVRGVQLTASEGNSTSDRGDNGVNNGLDLSNGVGKSGKLGPAGTSTQNRALRQVPGEVGEVAKLVLEGLDEHDKLRLADSSGGNGGSNSGEAGDGGEAANSREAEAVAPQAASKGQARH